MRTYDDPALNLTPKIPLVEKGAPKRKNILAHVPEIILSYDRKI